MGTQVVHTICMQTSDAIKKSEGEFVMKLSGDNPRLNAVKLALGSLELPVVQWTIEEDWSLMYFSEGFRLYAESSWLRIQEKTEVASNTIQIHLPLYLNAIVSIKQMGGNYFAVKTEFPHGLWVEGKRCILPAIFWSDVEIICSEVGKINISKLYEERNIEYLSEHEFLIQSKTTKLTENSFGNLYVPTIPSPQALCDLLNFALTYSQSLGSYSIKYMAEENRANLQSSKYPEDCTTLSVKLFGSDLTRILGYPSEEHSQKFYKKTVSETNLTNVENVQFNLQDGFASDPPLVLASEIFPAWMKVQIAPGWYSPAHRPMCTGTPLRISTEIENAFNKLYFQIPERIPKGHASSHFLVFSDPAGIQHLCPIFAGRYTPETICAYLEDEMTRLARTLVSETQFSIDYDYNTKKFTFSCEIRQDNLVVAAPFKISFNHPASVDPSRFGFPVTCLKGSDTYTSNEVHIPFMAWTKNKRNHTNSYKITEIGHQKRFIFESTSISNMTGLIKAYDSSCSELVIMTYVGQLPFVHGLQEHDVITILPCNPSELFDYDIRENHWTAHEFPACPLAFHLGKNGIVVNLGDIKKYENAPNTAQTHIRVRVRSAHDLSRVIGHTVNIAIENEPFNLCFGNLPKSIPYRCLGFGKGAIQWGIDGMIRSGNLNLPPFQANAVHSLDHPDYVLLYIEEGKKNLGLQHRSQNNTTTPFAKLVLYPMFREERMLPRDTTLLGSEFLSTFTIKFKNPDGTPYHFHDVDFSFSLNFIRQSDS